MNTEDYKQQLISLLPVGGIWPSPQVVNNLTKLLDAMAEELARIDGRIQNLVDEAFPNTALEMITDWERNTGLPFTCTGALETLQQRRAAILSVLTVERSLSASYYIELASRLGFDITIAETAAYTWEVTAAIDENAVYFRAGQSSAGQPLIQTSNNLLECVMQLLKPAHTVVTFNYI
ncbi:MAG TPA: putative phage tail protein [Gammaproteobacteria bacterium]